jgi:hypothetical protein
MPLTRLVRPPESSLIQAYLMSSSFGHIKFYVLERCALGDLPVNTTNGCISVSTSYVNLEVSNASQEVVLIDIPISY